MMKFWRTLFLPMVMFYADPPSLASGTPPVGDPPKDPPVGDPPKDPPVIGDPPAGPKPEDVTAATEFLSKNVDGFDPKDRKPEDIMALRGAYDQFTASEARKFLKSSGAKAEDVAKMSPADAIKAAETARAKPVEYAEFQLPQGMKKDEGLDKTFREWAGKQKLSQEAAQEIVSAYSTRLAEVMQQPYKAWQDLQKTWRDEVAKDPVVGGAALPQNLGQIGKMIDAVMGDKAKDVRAALDATGAGNNPAVIRFLFAASAPYKEGGPLSGNPAHQDKEGKGPAAKMYPSMVSETAGT